MLNPPSIAAIPVADPDVYAFRIRGEVTAEDMHAMAETMNAAFDAKSSVSMILIFEAFEGQEVGAVVDVEALKSQFRSLAHVEKYAVVGAPSAASKMINVMDKIIPVDARTFDATDEDKAWAFVGTRPLPGASA
ncbi:MAG: STAS/SEC14 domain-containing protein [Pararhodobacter sp.]